MTASDHLYVHVPFCDGKCDYCIFYSILYEPRIVDSYLDGLTREFDLHLDSHPRPIPQTIYIGGGTPSILTPSQLARLCEIVRGHIAPDLLREWTVEINPGTVTPEKIRVLLEAGVDRISVGVQSFFNPALEQSGRRHTSGKAIQAIDMIRSSGIANISMDLIAGLPEVTPTLWRQTLETSLAFHPAHLSVYALTVEEQTPIHQRIRSGAIIVPNEEALSGMLDQAEQILDHAGFEHYEISNYGKPGYCCRHNVSCWNGEDYLGFGPAAASRSGPERWTNSPDLNLYAQALGHGNLPPRTCETLSAARDVTERLMFGFRIREGVALDEFCSRFGAPARGLEDFWRRALVRMAGQGLVGQDGARWFLTARGRHVADAVAAELVPDDIV